MPISSGFGIPPFVLPEDTPQAAGGLFSQTPVLQSPEPLTPTAATYRPPSPVETPPTGEVWTETQENLLDSISAWKPLKEVSQEDLDHTLGAEFPHTHVGNSDSGPFGGGGEAGLPLTWA